MQLIQPYVQKSRSRIRPRSAARDSGAPPVLIQSRPAGKSGARTGAVARGGWVMSWSPRQASTDGYAGTEYTRALRRRTLRRRRFVAILDAADDAQFASARDHTPDG